MTKRHNRHCNTTQTSHKHNTNVTKAKHKFVNDFSMLKFACMKLFVKRTICFPRSLTTCSSEERKHNLTTCLFVNSVIDFARVKQVLSTEYCISAVPTQRTKMVPKMAEGHPICGCQPSFENSGRKPQRPAHLFAGGIIFSSFNLRT